MQDPMKQKELTSRLMHIVGEEGVILNLAIFFAHHVLWPQGFEGQFDLMSAVIAAGAAIALFRFKIGVMTLLAGSAASGLAVSWLYPLIG